MALDAAQVSAIARGELVTERDCRRKPQRALLESSLFPGVIVCCGHTHKLASNTESRIH